MDVPILRPFQERANAQVAAAARRGKRVIVLQSPTGSGKSTMGADLVRRADAKDARVLFIVHRRRLVDQFSARLRDFTVNHGVLMRGHPLERNARVQVASRDTLLSHRGEEFALPPADLVIVDEGRHAASPEFRKLLKPYEDSGAFIVLLDATPVLGDGTGLGPWAQEMVVAAKVSELVRDGFLVPVKCFAPDRKTGQGKTRRGIAGDLVASWLRYAEGLPTVAFFARVQHSLDAMEEFQKQGIPAVHVDASTPDGERDQIFDGLASGVVKVVGNVGILKEGTDIPCLACCQFYMDPPGRVGFLQGCGRIMRPHPDKQYGILIDHAGAVFRHGFPDEDTAWTLTGNVDAEFQRQHDDGLTEDVLYCKECELLYHGTTACPQCGRVPAQPPRSIFDAPPVESTNELLTEAERGERESTAKEEKIRTWFACLATAKKRHGTFGMAGQIYKRKYREWPGDDFPCMPPNRNWKANVEDVFPNFGRRKE